MTDYLVYDEDDMRETLAEISNVKTSILGSTWELFRMSKNLEIIYAKILAIEKSLVEGKFLSEIENVLREVR